MLRVPFPVLQFACGVRICKENDALRVRAEGSHHPFQSLGPLSGGGGPGKFHKMGRNQPRMPKVLKFENCYYLCMKISEMTDLYA